MEMIRVQPNKKYTYADYLAWPDEERWEIIDDIPYMLSSPTWQHQSVSGQLFLMFGNYLAGKPCRVFAAPFDLWFPERDEQILEDWSEINPGVAGRN